MTASAEPQFATIHGYAAKAIKGPLELWEYTPQPLGPNDVEIKIDHCGLCRSDIHAIDSDWGPTQYPVIVGHEVVGKVVTKGNRVTKYDVGDLVGVGGQVWACLKPDCRACGKGHDHYCPHTVLIYGDKYPDGEPSQGGFAEAIRVDSNHIFAIPKAIAPKEAAPLMCAGVTVFAPMLQHNVQAGDRVGVVGIGGLGHLALQFAKALGTKVTAFTSSENKRAECQKLGAENVVNLNDAEQCQTAAQSLDYLLDASGSPHTNWDQLAQFMDLHGKIILLAVPEKPMKLNAFSLLANGLSIVGSFIGGIRHMQATLDFAARHNVRPWIEELPMSEANKGVQRVRDGKVRYRVVLSN